MIGEIIMQLKDLKTSLFGFNKNDVCEYISQLNAVYEQKEQQIRQEQREILNELNQKNENLNNNVSTLGQENKELLRQKEILQNKAALLDGEIGKLKHQVEQMRDLFASAFENVAEQFNLLENQIDGLLTAQSGEKEDEQ